MKIGIDNLGFVPNPVTTGEQVTISVSLLRLQPHRGLYPRAGLYPVNNPYRLVPEPGLYPGKGLVPSTGKPH